MGAHTSGQQADVASSLAFIESLHNAPPLLRRADCAINAHTACKASTAVLQASLQNVQHSLALGEDQQPVAAQQQLPHQLQEELHLAAAGCQLLSAGEGMRDPDTGSLRLASLCLLIIICSCSSNIC